MTGLLYFYADGMDENNVFKLCMSGDSRNYKNNKSEMIHKKDNKYTNEERKELTKYKDYVNISTVFA